MEENKAEATSTSEDNLVKKGSSLASLMDSAYIVLGLDGTILEVNHAAQSLLGLTEETLVGSVFFERWAVPNMGTAMINQVIAERLVRGFETDIKRQDDETFAVSINAQLVIDQQDYAKNIECLVTDMTEGHKKQAEFEETLRSVTGGIAHIINNQMASVVGTADLVKMELGDRPELAEKLDRISESGLQASSVAHNLVDFADTSESLVMGEIDLNQVVTSVASDFTEKVLKEKPRNFMVKIDPNARHIFASEDAVRQMLEHLLNNAIDATEPRDVIILATKNVTLVNKKSGANKEYALVSVEDHGHGMDQKTQHRIFEPFFSTRFAGRGMSLAHVLKTVKKHNGQIKIKTGVGKGSIFKVYFPVSD